MAFTCVIYVTQTIPREVVFDKRTGTNVLQWPIKEVEKLRSKSTVFKKVVLEPGSLVPLDVGLATQVIPALK